MTAVPLAGVAVSVTVYVPVVVPPVVVVLWLPPPQPIPALAIRANSIAADRIRIVRIDFSAIFRRRPSGPPRKNSTASVTPPPSVNGSFRLDVVCAVVVTVNVDVTADAVVMLTEVGDSEQLGSSVAPVGAAVIAQVTATLPVNPPVGVTVTVDVPVAPWDAMVIAGALIVTPPGFVGAVTVSTKLSVTTGLMTAAPPAPVTVIV